MTDPTGTPPQRAVANHPLSEVSPEVCGELPPGNWMTEYLPVCQKDRGHDGEHQAQDYANASFGWPGPRWSS